MPIYLGNTAYDLYLGNVKQNVWLGERRITGSDAFEVADAGIDFQVSRPGLVSLSITTGTLKDTNFKNGDTIGTVATDTTHDLTGSIVVPNNAMWSNAGEDVTITGITAEQPGPFTPPPAEDRNRYSETFLDNVDAFNNVVNGTSSDQDCSTEDDLFLHVKSCYIQTTTSGHTPRYTLTCIAADGCDLVDGTIVDHGPVETGSTETEVCGDCTETNNGNPNYVPTFSVTDVAQYISVRIVPESGDIVATSNNDVVSVALAVGQQSSYTPLPYGSDPVIRTIDLVLTGTIPVDYKNAGNAYSFDYSVGASQRPAALLPPVISATVGYQSTSFGFKNLYPTNGSVTSITDFPTGGQYLVFGESTNDGAVTGDRGFFDGSTLGRKHILTATNAAGTDTIIFTVRTNTI